MLAKSISRTTAQAGLLQKGGHHKVGEVTTLNGARPDRLWLRPGCTQVRPELTNQSLCDAVEWMHARRGKEWTKKDEATREELVMRSWTWTEANRAKLISLPAWVDQLIPGSRKWGYMRGLGVLLAAYRAGAAGVLMGYHEWRALLQVRSDSTWRAWTKEWAELGLARVSKTWKQSLSAGKTEDGFPVGRQRDYGKLFIRLGPAFEEFAGPGLCEGATDGLAAAWAGRSASAARAKAAKSRNEERTRLWEAANGPTAKPDATEEPEPALASDVLEAVDAAEGPGQESVPTVGENRPPLVIVDTDSDANSDGRDTAEDPGSNPPNCSSIFGGHSPLTSFGGGIVPRPPGDGANNTRMSPRPNGPDPSLAGQAPPLSAEDVHKKTSDGNGEHFNPEIERLTSDLMRRLASRGFPAAFGQAPKSPQRSPKTGEKSPTGPLSVANTPQNDDVGPSGSPQGTAARSKTEPGESDFSSLDAGLAFLKRRWAAEPETPQPTPTPSAPAERDDKKNFFSSNPSEDVGKDPTLKPKKKAKTRTCTACNGRGVNRHGLTCRICHGVGKLTIDRRKKCGECHGSGVDMADKRYRSGEIAHPPACKRCAGTGLP